MIDRGMINPKQHIKLRLSANMSKLNMIEKKEKKREHKLNGHADQNVESNEPEPFNKILDVLIQQLGNPGKLC